MIGPLTYTGWVSILAIIAVWAAMIRFGLAGKWQLGLALTAPFVAVLIWVEFNTAGPPMWADPYGPLLFAMIAGPIFLGWILFALAFASRRLTKHG